MPGVSDNRTREYEGGGGSLAPSPFSQYSWHGRVPRNLAARAHDFTIRREPSYITRHGHATPRHTLIKMFFVFLIETEPTSSIAKPAWDKRSAGSRGADGKVGACKRRTLANQNQQQNNTRGKEKKKKSTSTKHEKACQRVSGLST